MVSPRYTGTPRAVTALDSRAANECASMRMTMATSIGLGLGLGFSVFRFVFVMPRGGG